MKLSQFKKEDICATGGRTGRVRLPKIIDIQMASLMLESWDLDLALLSAPSHFGLTFSSMHQSFFLEWEGLFCAAVYWKYVTCFLIL